MTIMRELRKRARHILPAVFGTAIVGYFSYHAVQGEHGLFSYMRISHEVEQEQAVLAELQAEKSALEKRVRGLRGSGIDLDLLEERARRVLNLMRDDEISVPFKDR
jgi:cell division protein FtsB